MDKTCKFCKWWDDGKCELVDRILGPSKTQFEINVRVSDDTGLEATLLTGPDFGCNQHSPIVPSTGEEDET